MGPRYADGSGASSQIFPFSGKQVDVNKYGKIKKKKISFQNVFRPHRYEKPAISSTSVFDERF